MRARLVRVTPLLVVAALATAVWIGHARTRLPDFEVYRTAAARARRAEPLYRADDGHWQFKYLPAFAVAAAPMARLRADVARPLWYTLSVALLVLFVRRCVAELPGRRLTDRALTWLAILCLGRFYVHEIVLGQTNLLLGCLLVGALGALQRERRAAAGALVAAAVFVKPYAAILLPWLVVAGGVPAVAAAAGVLGAGLVAPTSIYGWAGNAGLLADWWRTVTATTAPNLTFPENISLASMWAKWIGPSRGATMAAAASTAFLAAAMAMVVARRRHVASPVYLEFGLLMLAVPLVSPQGWDYVLLLATPAVLCVVNHWPASVGLRLVYGAALAIVGLTIFDLLGRALYAAAMAHAIVSVAAILIGAALVHLRFTRQA